MSPLRGEPVDLAVHDGDAWAVTGGDDRLWRAPAVGGRVVATRPLPGEPAGIVAASDRVWVAVRRPATLLSYDRTSLDLIESIDLPQDRWPSNDVRAGHHRRPLVLLCSRNTGDCLEFRAE